MNGIFIYNYTQRPKYLYIVGSDVRCAYNLSPQARRYHTVRTADKVWGVQNILYLNNNSKENALLHFCDNIGYRNVLHCLVPNNLIYFAMWCTLY